jgi:hypothetical protein
MDLSQLIDMTSVECLNQATEHPVANIFPQNKKKKLIGKSTETYLESDADEQLLIHIPFTQNVKLMSFALAAPEDGMNLQSSVLSDK